MIKLRDILIVCATKSEHKVITKVFDLEPNYQFDELNITQGSIDYYQIFCVHTDIGVENAIYCLNKFSHYFKPKIIINFGAAGSINPKIKPGMLVIPNNIVRVNNSQCTENIFYQPYFNVEPEIMSVNMGTVDVFFHSKKKKTKLMGESIDTIDCETYAIAKYCVHNMTDYFIFRCISDQAGPFALIQYYWNIRCVLKKGAKELLNVLNKNNISSQE
ncbi:MAG: hypothetical protein FWG91_01300 [Lachnospiraceae bacterium]|nr:hypothetical protein [Lachnospiraceae bacterium]